MPVHDHLSNTPFWKTQKLAADTSVTRYPEPFWPCCWWAPLCTTWFRGFSMLAGMTSNPFCDSDTCSSPMGSVTELPIDQRCIWGTLRWNYTGLRRKISKRRKQESNPQALHRSCCGIKNLGLENKNEKILLEKVHKLVLTQVWRAWILLKRIIYTKEWHHYLVQEN